MPTQLKKVAMGVNLWGVQHVLPDVRELPFSCCAWWTAALRVANIKLRRGNFRRLPYRERPRE